MMGSLFSGVYFYSKYKKKYSGWKGKTLFLKDQLNLHARSAPSVIASYVAYPFLTAAGLALGLGAGPAAALASVSSSILYIGGAYLSSKGYLKKISQRFGYGPNVPYAATH